MEITHFIRKEEIGELSNKAIKRTARMGASCVEETMALLENEIVLYRKRVDFLEHELERAKEQRTQAETIEATNVQGLTINADTAYITVYPAGILEKGVKD